jgi:hypothetical protein
METRILTTRTQPFEGNKYYQKSADAAFVFAKSEKNIEQLGIKKEEYESRNDEQTSFWKVASFAAIFIAFGLGYIEAQNTKNSISGLFYTGDANEMSPFLLGILGVTFAGIGLLLGNGLQTKTDSITGKKKLTTNWWLCLFASIGYIYFQYYLASSASIGTDADTQQIAHSQSVFVIFIAVAELLLGYLFLHKAIDQLLILSIKITIRIKRFRLNNAAKSCCQNWDYYIGYVEDYNIKNPFATITAKAETENIKRAKLFYKDSTAYTFL